MVYLCSVSVSEFYSFISTEWGGANNASSLYYCQVSSLSVYKEFDSETISYDIAKFI